MRKRLTEDEIDLIKDHLQKKENFMKERKITIGVCIFFNIILVILIGLNYLRIIDLEFIDWFLYSSVVISSFVLIGAIYSKPPKIKN